MSKSYPIKATPRVLFWLLFSSAALAAGPLTALKLIHSERPEAWIGWLAVVIAVLGVLPILVFVAVAILRLTDEWHRHVGLVGYAAGLSGAIVFFVAVDMLKSARLIEPWSLTPVWPWLFGWLAAGLLGSALWHKRQS